MLWWGRAVACHKIALVCLALKWLEIIFTNVVGIGEGKRQTIVPAYQDGIAIEDIASFTGLSIDAVKQVLRKEGIE